jgi:hypothetical protein
VASRNPRWKGRFPGSLLLKRDPLAWHVHGGRLGSVAIGSDGTPSGRLDGLHGGTQIGQGEPPDHLRAGARGDRVARASDDEQVAVADVGDTGRGGQRRSGSPRELGVTGERGARAVQHGRRVQIDRERREPGERLRRGERSHARDPDRPGPAGGRDACVLAARDNARVTVTRIAWLVTVLACIVSAVVMLLSGYVGYAAVFGAVGACAAINLT